MRLLEATIRQYRVHRETRVVFDPRLTLVSGANESGKSTLVEAIHRVLFFRAKAGGEVRDRMRSDWGEPPEVTLSFEADGKRATVFKSFRGAGARCSLDVAGEGTLTGDAAEERLAQLLKSGAAASGRGAEALLTGRWAHVWVRQGESGDMPTETLHEQQDLLVQRLQAEGGAAVTQSDLDARVIRMLQERRDAWWTRLGAKAGTEWNRAELAVESLQGECEARQQRLTELEDAAERSLVAARTLAEQEQARTLNTAALAEVRRKRQQADDLERELDPLRRTRAALEADLTGLDKLARDLAAIRVTRDAARAALQPRLAELQGLQAELEVGRQSLAQAESALEKARERAVTSRLWQSALADQAQALDLARQRDQRRGEQVEIVAKRAALAAVRESLAQTPPIHSRELETLRKLEASVAAQRAGLDALGARIEVLAADPPVRVNGDPVAAGERRIITQDVEVALGPVPLLRIRPGGHTGIAGARAAVEKAERLLSEKLLALGVSSLEAAIAAAATRGTQEEQQRFLVADLARLEADSHEASLLACVAAGEEATRRAQTAAAQVNRELPATLAETRRARDEIEEACERAAREEQAAKAAQESARRQVERLEAACGRAREDAQGAQDGIRDAEIRLATLEEQQGSDETRAVRERDLRGRLDQVVAQAVVVQAGLDALQPALLDADITRLQGAVERASEAMARAETARAMAQGMLTLNGSTDPRAELEDAQARVEQATVRARELRAQAEAIRYLAQEAEALQRATAQRFVEPLSAKAEGYLACLFGPGVRVRLDWNPEQQAFAMLRVDRSAGGQGVFEFAALSGGTREQVGIAMRLAMAEVLAAAHDGCLPVVLDDAFANADPVRVQALQRMLYLAADRGLQVIVLSCTPADYRTLGAHEIPLQRPTVPLPSVGGNPLSPGAPG